MTKTFSAYTSNGIVTFSVTLKESCIYALRCAAMDECDRQGWVLKGIAWL